MTRTCELLGGISLSTLDRLVEAGVLKPVKFTPNAHRRFRIEDIEALVVAEKEDKTVNYEVPVAPEDELRFEQRADDERYAILASSSAISV